MAFQTGIVRLSGKAGELSFYQSNGKDLARKPGGPSRDQVLNSTKFVRTRENASEFGRTRRDTRLLWEQCLLLMGKGRDGTANQRLFQVMLKAMKGDPINARGERTLREGFKANQYKKLLYDFEFNRTLPVRSVLHLPIELDTTTNTLSISDLNPKLHLNSPEGTRFVRFSAAIITAHQQSWNLTYYASSVQEVALVNVKQDVQLDFADPIDKTDCYCFYLFSVAFGNEAGEVWGMSMKMGGGVVLGMG